jgi:ribose transport system substrate-binding protein
MKVKANIIIFIIFLSSVSFFNIQIVKVLEATKEQIREISVDGVKNIQNSKHYVLILKETKNSYWRNIEKGARDAARYFGIVLEVFTLQSDSIKDELYYFKKAKASKVDGIITYIPSQDEFLPEINDAIEKNIPVVTIYTDLQKSKRNAYIGINWYEAGYKAGTIMLKNLNSLNNIAIITEEYKKNVADQEKINTMIKGFNDSITEKSTVKIQTIETCIPGIANGKQKAMYIFEKYPGVNAIYCTNSLSTIGVAQCVKEMNKQHDIILIGYGFDNDIRKYLKEGIIQGTIMDFPYKIGYKSIETIQQIQEGKRVMTFIDTGTVFLSKYDYDF